MRAGSGIAFPGECTANTVHQVKGTTTTTFTGAPYFLMKFIIQEKGVCTQNSLRTRRKLNCGGHESQEKPQPRAYTYVGPCHTTPHSVAISLGNFSKSSAILSRVHISRSNQPAYNICTYIKLLHTSN